MRIDAEATRYRRARELALRALDLPEVERPAFLERSCRNDMQLHQEALWLLQAAEDEGADELPVKLDLARLVREGSDSAPPRVEAPLPRDYRLLRRICEGGMGVV